MKLNPLGPKSRQLVNLQTPKAEVTACTTPPPPKYYTPDYSRVVNEEHYSLSSYSTPPPPPPLETPSTNGRTPGPPPPEYYTPDYIQLLSMSPSPPPPPPPPSIVMDKTLSNVNPLAEITALENDHVKTNLATLESFNNNEEEQLNRDIIL